MLGIVNISHPASGLCKLMSAGSLELEGGEGTSWKFPFIFSNPK